MEEITGKNNRIIKDTKKLFSSSKARRENNSFVLEGARLCFDVLNSFYKVNYVLITENAYNKYRSDANLLIERADSAYFISEDNAQRLSDTVACQGVFAVCSMNTEAPQINGKKYIALDNVQDPSNMGNIIRTAEALGIDGIITFNCCDIYNPKVLRASMGSVLRCGIIDTDNLEDFLINMKDGGFALYSTVPDSKATKITEIDFSEKTVCVIGNEANGVEENIKNISNSLITIPMLGRAESLNAATAAALTMWEMLR
ncbi:MAG: TrmH family RNA methyltransferase [Eubacterium sp.]